MTRGQNFFINAKCTHGHRSAMSNSAWCGLKKDCIVLKLHDLCHNPQCKCQKQTIFSRRQFHLEGNGFKNTMKKILRNLKQLGIFETDDKYTGTSDRDGSWSKKQK